jgi:uncharacterized protein
VKRLTNQSPVEAILPTIDAVWISLRWPGIEHAHIEPRGEHFDADSRAILVLEGAPLRVEYRLAWDVQWCARTLLIRTESQGRVDQLELRSDGRGTWTDGEGASLPGLDGCLDVDIAMTPLTNTLPIRRLGLAVGERREMDVAYVKIPGLVVVPVAQSYEYLESTPAGGLYRYQSSTFQAELRVDRNDFVVNYPTVWERIPVSETEGTL